MAYDGIIASAVVWELSGLIEGSRIAKIYQAERDEILLLCHRNGEHYRLLISCNPVNPRLHLCRSAKENPAVAPPFCMILRKHIQGGRIGRIVQSGYDRVIAFEIETLNEMGDPVVKRLIVEIMGRHSNIILVGPSGVIYDAIRHVDGQTNSVRELLPARPYTPPPAQSKLSPEAYGEIAASLETSSQDAELRSTGLSSFLLRTVSGFSPFLCTNLCLTAGLDPARRLASLSDAERFGLLSVLEKTCEYIREHRYTPFILLDGESADAFPPKAAFPPEGGGNYREFHCLSTARNGYTASFSSVNLLLDEFFTRRDTEERLRQRRASLAKHLHTLTARAERKIAIYESDLEGASDYDSFRIRGELINANLYRIGSEAKSVLLENYYEEGAPALEIPLDENLSPAANAQQYFRRYRKKKSTWDNARKNLLDAQSELAYLRSVSVMLENCTENADIEEIREEMTAQGLLTGGERGAAGNGARPHGKGKKAGGSGRPGRTPEGKHAVFQVRDGYEVWVGKNNTQNDRITLKLAAPDDLFLHVKNAPGSHVILRASLAGGRFTEAALMDAAALAARNSSQKGSPKVEVDYTRVKHVKKPGGAPPGKVIYTNQKTVIAVCRNG